MRTLGWMLPPLAAFAAAATGLHASGGLTLERKGSEIRYAASVPGPAVAMELRIHSDRNRAISKFSDASPLDPRKTPPRITRGNEMWFPVVDVRLVPEMEGVAVFDDPAGLYAINGWFRPAKKLLSRTVVIPARDLDWWENSLWLEPGAAQLREFYLRLPLRASDASVRGRIELLTQDWGGRLALHAGDRELSRAELARPELKPPPIGGGADLNRDRLVESLAATVAYTLRSQNRNPASPTSGGLHLFYDLDARVYRSSHWIWGWAPSVRMLLDAAKIPEVAARFPPGELAKVAGEIGAASLRFAEDKPLEAVPTSRWERNPDHEFGYREALTPADAGFLMGWAWIPLYEATGERKYLDASKKLAATLERLWGEFGLIPQNYWTAHQTWSDFTIDESGFGVEGLAELYRVTKDERYRAQGVLYSERHAARLERPDGLWDRAYTLSRGRSSPTAKMTRGMGWAMEGLLATHRLDPRGRWLRLADRMGQHLIGAQRPDGSWAFRFDQPAEEVGTSEKGTALWSMLFYRAYAASNDDRHLAPARKALRWCLSNQYSGPDPEAHGSLVGVSPQSAVGYRSWFRVSCTYTSAFFGLAVLEDLRLGAGNSQKQSGH